MVRHDDSFEDIELNPKINPVEQLSRYIFKEGPRDEALPYKAVEIFLPLELLKVSISLGIIQQINIHLCYTCPVYIYTMPCLYFTMPCI